MKNYPALFYEKEKDAPVSIAGYTLALGLMAAGVAETVVHFTKEGKTATPLGGWLGPLLITTGGVAAYGYLREADIVY